MATIIKNQLITIKASNPKKDNVESITCMALESNTRSGPIDMLWIYRNNSKMSEKEFMPSIELQSTLSDALNHFPILAGRLTEDINGNATIHLTNEGVLFTEAKCTDQALDYFLMPDENGDFDYENINASDLGVSVAKDWTVGPMVSIQVTRLQCNSVILSITAFHCLMDAQSTADFINSWASGGKTLQKYPMLDKKFVLCSSEELPNNSISRPSDCVFNRNMDASVDSPFTEKLKQRVITKVYHFSIKELENIKDEAMKGLPSTIDYISTYDALYAHMILVIANATQTSLTEPNNIKILQSLNGRSRFVASHSSDILNYFGSFPFWLYKNLSTEETPTISSLAQFIHDAYSKQTEQSLKYYNAYLYSDDGDIRKNQVDADLLNRDFYCSSWRKVDMLGPNFGGGDNYPIYSGPTKLLYPRYFAMMDAHHKDQSINIILGLREEDYQRMIEQNLLHKFR